MSGFRALLSRVSTFGTQVKFLHSQVMTRCMATKSVVDGIPVEVGFGAVKADQHYPLRQRMGSNLKD